MGDGFQVDTGEHLIICLATSPGTVSFSIPLQGYAWSFAAFSSVSAI